MAPAHLGRSRPRDALLALIVLLALMLGEENDPEE
jgi:hypothetical protein